MVNTTVDERDGSCTDSDCSLRDAIASARTGNTIIIPAGTYTLTLGITLAVDKDLTLVGAGGSSTIIQAATGPNTANFPVLTVSLDQNVGISGVTIRHGNGGVSIVTGSLTLTNSAISNNNATESGGGIRNTVGRLTLTNTSVSGNTTQGAGGGIRTIRGELTLTKSTVSGNSASDRGGGIFHEHGSTLLTDSTVSGNTATDGGGIYIGVVELSLTNSTISGNTARKGGGIHNSGGLLSLTNSTVSGNTANSGNGGGILNDHRGTLRNSTVSANTANSGGGISNNGTMESVNTIIARNTAATGPDCRGSLASLGHNLIGNATGCSLTPGPGDLMNSDPKLGPLQDNGGPTFTQPLLPGSPAVDTGDNTKCPATDQRGMSRPQGRGCDIGAFERN